MPPIRDTAQKFHHCQTWQKADRVGRLARKLPLPHHRNEIVVDKRDYSPRQGPERASHSLIHLQI